MTIPARDRVCTVRVEGTDSHRFHSKTHRSQSDQVRECTAWIEDQGARPLPAEDLDQKARWLATNGLDVWVLAFEHRGEVGE